MSVHVNYSTIFDVVKQYENFTESRKIVDGFIFYNELAMLEYRLNVLDPIIDHFVLVESRQTFLGNNKQLYFNENKEKFKKWLPKIVHVIIDLPYKNDAWGNEAIQRNSIHKGISTLSLEPDDLIIISDVDEILDPITLSLQKTEFKKGCSKLEMDMYYYNMKHKLAEPWYNVKLMTMNYYLENKSLPDSIRRSSPNDIIKKGGWHLSYFGSPDFIRNKIQQFSHQEYNTDDITNTTYIKQQIQNGGDLFHRPEIIIIKIKKEDNLYLPPSIEQLEKLLH